jgi:hypothetical protein
MFFIFSILLTFLVSVNCQCVITLPDNVFTEKGLSTPFTVDGCDQLNVDQASFAQAGIITNNCDIFIYNPLLVSRGGKFVKPVIPSRINESVVGIWFGTNSASITLKNQQNCFVSGSQFASCNGKG